MQIMRELRHGVKLKKVQATITHPVEYELTPYEILMDDLRYKRYTLNKVQVSTLVKILQYKIILLNTFAKTQDVSHDTTGNL